MPFFVTKADHGRFGDDGALLRRQNGSDGFWCRRCPSSSPKSAGLVLVSTMPVFVTKMAPTVLASTMPSFVTKIDRQRNALPLPLPPENPDKQSHILERKFVDVLRKWSWGAKPNREPKLAHFGNPSTRHKPPGTRHQAPGTRPGTGHQRRGGMSKRCFLFV